MDRAENPRTLESIQKRGRWKSAKSVRRHEKSGRVNQSWSELAPLVQAHNEHCNNLLSSVLLHGHASPTPLRLLRLLCSISSAQAPICNGFFLNRGIQCARLDLSSGDNTIFQRGFKRFCASWQVVEPSPYNALAASIFALSCQKSWTSANTEKKLSSVDSCFSVFLIAGRVSFVLPIYFLKWGSWICKNHAESQSEKIEFTFTKEQ